MTQCCLFCLQPEESESDSGDREAIPSSTDDSTPARGRRVSFAMTNTVEYTLPPPESESESQSSEEVQHKDTTHGVGPVNIETQLESVENVEMGQTSTVSPEAQIPETDGSETDSSAVQSPEAQIPESDDPEADSSAVQSPEAESPKAESPKAESPEGESPKGESSEGESPKGQSPKDESPEGESPEGESPEGESPTADLTEGECLEATRPEADDPVAGSQLECSMEGMESIESQHTEEDDIKMAGESEEAVQHVTDYMLEQVSTDKNTSKR